MTGVRFGRLVSIKQVGSRRGKALWLCQCDCGNTVEIVGQRIRRGMTRSCGCLQKEEASAKRLRHGATQRNSRWPEWGIYRAMINRCHREKTHNFHNYGGRGIVVCDRWRFGDANSSGFECFIADMGRRPAPELSIDRKDHDGNYEPSNCRWATSSEQRKNQRSKL